MSAFWLVISGTLIGAVAPGVSVLYAVYGELITERAGRINLGMEGCLLMGACFGFIATAETGSAAVGVLGGTGRRGLSWPRYRPIWSLGATPTSWRPGWP